MPFLLESQQLLPLLESLYPQFSSLLFSKPGMDLERQKFPPIPLVVLLFPLKGFGMIRQQSCVAFGSQRDECLSIDCKQNLSGLTYFKGGIQTFMVRRKLLIAQSNRSDDNENSEFLLLIKFTDSDIRTKKSRYPDPDSALTDPTFYYPDPDSASPDIRIFGSDPDRITDRIRISDKSSRPKSTRAFWLRLVDLSVCLESGCGDRLSSSLKQHVRKLLKKNTEGFYGSDWPLQAKVKRKEMSSTDVRYIFVRELRCGDAYEASTQKDLRGRIVGFVHYRFTLEEEIHVLNVYEIQLESQIQGKGLGECLMQLIELIASKNQMNAIVLTVQTSNALAKTFYMRKLG
ncbi:hypothetical protein YC2023_020677 [Brassica napus]